MLETYVKRVLETGSEKDAFSIVNYCRCNELFHIGLLFGKLFSEIFSHHWNILTESALCAYHSGQYDLSHDLFNRVLSFTNLTDDLVKSTIFNAHFCINSVLHRYSYYNPDIVTTLVNRKPRPFPLITFTVTSCKRFDLFERSINSFLNCCTDILKIDKWFCVDDNSNEEDRKKMKEKYPFFTFYFKTPAEKGHPQSMNIIHRNLDTPYVFHMEDDWQFFTKRDYMSDCLDVLHSSTDIGQCLINKNYGETERDVSLVGGIPKKTTKGLRYFIHEYTPTKEAQEKFNKKYNNYGYNCSYWPHFSFRPSLVKSSILRQLGEFNESVSHFERDYSHRYINKGYVSAFLENIYCTHIGRLTSERHDKTKPNAYELNNELQFSGKEEKVNKDKEIKELQEYKDVPMQKKILLNFNIKVINMDRRPDRWKKFQKNDLKLNYTRFSAIDGNKLVPNPQLSRIFDGNDYNMRKGMVGCAMSHIQLCIELLNSTSDFYCILEDDAELSPNFKDKLFNIIVQLPVDWDMIYLGHHYYPQHRKDEYYDRHTQPKIEKWDRAKSLRLSMGGTGGYLITKKGARKLLNFINRTGMTNGIDTVQQKSADELDIYYCIPHLIFAECYLPDSKVKTDTDIQFCYDSLTVDVDTRFVDEKKFYNNSPWETIIEFNTMKVCVVSENQDKVLFYRDDDPSRILELQKLCIYPCYTLLDKVLVVVPKPTEHQLDNRYFQRLNKRGEFNVQDALKYK